MEFKVLDELTEELLVTAVKKSLNVPPVSLCLNDEQSSRDDDSIPSPVKWIMVPRVLDKLLEFEEVSSEIKNADTTYGNHLPPLPPYLVSAPELETRLQQGESPAIDISTPTFVSVPNWAERPDLYVETPVPAEIASTPNRMSPQVASEIYIPEHLDSDYSLEARTRDCMTDIAVIPVGDALDLPSVTPCETEFPDFNTAKNTDVTAVERRRPVPHRSFWRRTKKFVRRLFCCGSMDQKNIYHIVLKRPL